MDLSKEEIEAFAAMDYLEKLEIFKIRNDIEKLNRLSSKTLLFDMLKYQKYQNIIYKEKIKNYNVNLSKLWINRSNNKKLDIKFFSWNKTKLQKLKKSELINFFIEYEGYLKDLDNKIDRVIKRINLLDDVILLAKELNLQIIIIILIVLLLVLIPFYVIPLINSILVP